MMNDLKPPNGFAIILVLGLQCTIARAFTAGIHGRTNALSAISTIGTSSSLFESSYDCDSDESTEQLLADESQAKNGISVLNGSNKYDGLLSDLGLTGELSCVGDLSENSQVSCHGVFCNRELNLGGIRAIGFDMDYTLAQYKQPAFDRLAFDGAKEKLVAMGYPEELLEVEYDHTVRIHLRQCEKI